MKLLRLQLLACNIGLKILKNIRNAIARLKILINS